MFWSAERRGLALLLLGISSTVVAMAAVAWGQAVAVWILLIPIGVTALGLAIRTLASTETNAPLIGDFGRQALLRVSVGLGLAGFLSVWLGLTLYPQ